MEPLASVFHKETKLLPTLKVKQRITRKGTFRRNSRRFLMSMGFTMMNGLFGDRTLQSCLRHSIAKLPLTQHFVLGYFRGVPPGRQIHRPRIYYCVCPGACQNTDLKSDSGG